MEPLDAALFASAYALVVLPVFPIATHHWPSTLAALVAAGAVLDDRWALAGAATGLAVSLHHAKGLLLLGGIAAACVVRTGRFVPAPRPAARFAAGLAAALAPVLLALAAAGALDDALIQTVLNLPDRSAQWFPYYADAGGPLWPRLGSALIAYGTPLGLVAALLRLVRRGPDADGLGPAALMGAALWASCLYRPDASHIHFVAPLGALLAYRTAIDARFLRPAARAATAYAALVAACLTAWAAAREAPYETRRGALRANPRDPARAWTAAIEDRVAPGEETFIYPYASGLYFHAGVRNATSFEQVKPFVQNAPREVERARAELATARPRYVFDQWDLYRWTFRDAFPLAPRAAFGPNPFGDLLAEGYLPEAVVAGMVVWRRRDLPETPPVE